MLKTGGEKSPANGDMTIKEAQANYIVYSASSPELIECVRTPTKHELNHNWKPFDDAITLAQDIRIHKTR